MTTVKVSEKRIDWRIGTVSYIDQQQIKFQTVSEDITDRLLWGQLRHINSLNQYLFAYLGTSTKVVFKVTAIEESNRPYNQSTSENLSEEFTFTASPLGQISHNSYKPGVVDIPMVGSYIYACDTEDLSILFNCGGAETIGRLAGYQDVRPSVNLDDFFSGHTAVLGNTGSGKSTTVRLVLSKLLRELQSEKSRIKEEALFIVFDLHRDYESIMVQSKPGEDQRAVYYKSGSFHLPPGKLKISDWASILNPSQRIQKPLLERAIRYSRLDRTGQKKLCAVLASKALSSPNVDSHATRKVLLSSYAESIADTPYPPDDKIETLSIKGVGKQPTTVSALLQCYDLHYGNLPENLVPALQACFKFVIEDGDKQEKEKNPATVNIEDILNRRKYHKPLDSISMEDVKTALDFVFAEEEVKGNKQARSYSEGLVTQLNNLAEKYSENIFKTSETKSDSVSDILGKAKGCVVFDVSDMPDSDGLKLFSNYVAREMFERNRTAPNRFEQPVSLVFDEAHRYIREQDLTDDSIFNQIAREGRKFGTHLMMISQIPSELSKVVLSQTSAFIIHRIQNSVDLDYIKKNVPAISADQVKRLPSFAPGTATVLGSALKIPMELEVDGDYRDVTPKVSIFKK